MNKSLRMKREAGAGIEPAIEVLQTSALPLGYPANRPGDSGWQARSKGRNARGVNWQLHAPDLRQGC